MMRPAREKKRRRRVLVVTGRSPRPMRVVQRARTPYRVRGRLCTASQAPLAGKRPEGSSGAASGPKTWSTPLLASPWQNPLQCGN